MANTYTWTDMSSDTNSGTSHNIWSIPVKNYSVVYTNLYSKI